MAGRIQQQPRSLLSFLGLKTTGVNASLWPDHVQPTLDLGAFYDQLEIHVGQFSFEAEGTQFFELPTPASAYRLYSVGIINTTAFVSGEDVDFGVYLKAFGSDEAATLFRGRYGFGPLAVYQSTPDSIWFPQPLVIPVGWRINIQVTELTVSTTESWDLQANALLSRIPG